MTETFLIPGVCFITARKQSCEKVMFSVVSVCHSVHRGEKERRKETSFKTPPPTRLLDTFQLFDYETRTVGKRTVEIPSVGVGGGIDSTFSQITNNTKLLFFPYLK